MDEWGKIFLKLLMEFLSAMAEGSVVYLLVKSKDGAPLKIAGRLVECKGESVVVAVNPKDVESVEQTLTATAPWRATSGFCSSTCF